MFQKTSGLALTSLLLLFSCPKELSAPTPAQQASSAKAKTPTTSPAKQPPIDKRALSKNIAAISMPQQVRPCAPRFVGEAQGLLKNAGTQIKAGFAKKGKKGLVKGRVDVTFKEGIKVEAANLLLQKYNLRVAMHQNETESAVLCTETQKEVPKAFLETLEKDAQILSATPLKR